MPIQGAAGIRSRSENSQDLANLDNIPIVFLQDDVYECYGKGLPSSKGISIEGIGGLSSQLIYFSRNGFSSRLHLH